jgi:hypothetical protein
VALNGFGVNTNKENIKNSCLLLLELFIFLYYSFCCYGYRWLLCLPHFCRGAATSIICGIIITDGRKLKVGFWDDVYFHVFISRSINIHPAVRDLKRACRLLSPPRYDACLSTRIVERELCVSPVLVFKT